MRMGERKEGRIVKDCFHSERVASIYAWYLRRLGYDVDTSITRWTNNSKIYTEYIVEGKKTVMIRYSSGSDREIVSFETKRKIAKFIERHRGIIFIFTIILIVFFWAMSVITENVLWNIPMMACLIFWFLQFLPLEMMIDGVG
jgi:hypothetical protein